MSWTFQNVYFGNSGGSSTSQTVTLTGVSVGDLVVVGANCDFVGTATLSVSDSASNTYTTQTTQTLVNVNSTISYTVVTSAPGGNLTITVTFAVTAIVNVQEVCRYSVSSGSTISFIGFQTSKANTTSRTTPGQTFSGAGNFLVVGCGATFTTAVLSAPYTTRKTLNGGTFSAVIGDQLNLLAASSPQTATIATSPSTSQNIVVFCAVFLETLGPPAVNLTTPTTVPANTIPILAPTIFTVTPNQSLTAVVTPSDSGSGGTFVPTSLTFTSSAVAQTFTYTPTITGSISISISSTITVGGTPIVLTSAYNPLSYNLASVLGFWYEPEGNSYTDLGVTLATNSQTVEQINDLSGNGNNLTQTTSGSRSTYLTSLLNGHAGISHPAGSSTFYSCPYSGEVAEIIVVFMSTVEATGQTIFGAGTTDAVSIPAYAFDVSTADSTTTTLNATWNPLRFTRTTTSDTTAAKTLSAETIPLWDTWEIASSSLNTSTPSSAIYRFNSLCNSITGTGTVRPINSAKVAVGAGYPANGSAANFFKGQWVEMFAYAQPLTPTARTNLYNYLSTKYGISLAWPVSIPTHAGAFFHNPATTGGNVSLTNSPAACSLAMISSTDGFNFTYQPAIYQFPSGFPSGVQAFFRDPSIIYFGGQWLMFHTSDAAPGFAVATSPDGIHWTYVASIDGSIPGEGNQAAPNPFVDPNTGILHVLYRLGNFSTGNNIRIYEVHPITPGIYTAWSAPVAMNLSDGTTHTLSDPWMVYTNSTYYLIYTYYPGTGSEYINVATSSTMFGTYTPIKTGNWLAGPNIQEGGIVLGSGNNWTIYIDESATIGYQYATSTTGITGTYGSFTACGSPFLNAGNVQHGSLIPFPPSTPPPTPTVYVGTASVGRDGKNVNFIVNQVTGTTVVNVNVTAGGSGYTAPVASIKGGITITLDRQGAYYATAPVISISAPPAGGVQALATCTIFGPTTGIPPGGINTITITNPGSGYVTPPTISFSGGSGRGAQAHATITTNGGIGCVLGAPVVQGGVIVAIPVQFPGSGYTSIPTVTITDLTGIGATATAVLGGAVANITNVFANPVIEVNGTPVQSPLYVNSLAITIPGTGYSAPATFTATPSSGVAASGTCVVTASGGVALTLNTPGSNYTSPPTVTFTGGTGGSGTSATAFINASTGQVTGFTVVPGSGWSGAPTVTITGGGGTGATATATIVGGQIASATVAFEGSGFLASSAPTIAFAGGGSNAAGTAILGPIWSTGFPFVNYPVQCGSIASLFVQNGGTLYSSTPTVTITGGGGSGASAGVVTIINGVITAFTMSGTWNTGMIVQANDSTGIGFSGYWTVLTPTNVNGTSPTSVTSTVVEHGGSGYTSPTLFQANFGGGGGGGSVSFTGNTISNGIISAISLISGGSGYTSAPTITVTDSTGSGAVVVAIMSGIVSTDVVTYTAPYGWLQATSAVGAAANASAMNLQGQLESWMNATPSTMQAGMNIGFPWGWYTGVSNCQNWLTVSQNWTGASQPFTGPTQRTLAATLTNGSGSITLGTSTAGLTNLLVFFPGDSSGGIYTFTSGSGTAWTISPVFGGTGMTSTYTVTIPATNIAVYNGASDTTGGIGSQPVVYGVVNSTGNVTSAVVLCGGVNYTATPHIKFPTPTVGVAATGTCTIAGGIITAVAIGTGGSGYGGSTIDGLPVAINNTTDPSGSTNGGAPSAYTTVSDAGNAAIEANFTDYRGYPDQSGVWTVTGNENNVSGAMTVRFYGGIDGIFYTPTLIHGSVSGNVETGKIWQFNVTRATASERRLQLFVVVTAASAATSAPFTLSNLIVTSPNRKTKLSQPANQAVPLTGNGNIVNWLQNSAGTVGSATLRCWPFQDFVWTNNVIDASDLRSPTNFTWQDGPANGNFITVINVRQYQIASGGTLYPGWNSPNVFASENWPGTVASGGSPLPWQWVPPGNTVNNTLQWMSLHANCQSIGAEMITSAPHGLKTGMIFTPPGIAGMTTGISIIDVNNSNNIVTGAVGGGGFTCTILVTGASSFAYLYPSNSAVTLGTNTANVSGQNTTTAFQINLPITAGFGSPPYAAFANLAADIPGCGLQIFMPYCATDACITNIAQQIRDILPVGRKVYPEIYNEHWNFAASNPGFYQCYTFSGLYSTGSVSITSGQPDQFFAYRQSHVHSIFYTVFNQADINGITNRGDSIVRMFGGQSGNPNVLHNIALYANTFNTAFPSSPTPLKIDAGLMAPYGNIPDTLASRSVAASTYSSYLGSPQYETNVPWTLGQLTDYMRWCVYYKTGPLYAPQFSSGSGIGIYTPIAGQTASPFLINYEESIYYAAPNTVSTTTSQLRSYINHDVFFHPYFCDANTAYYTAMQQNGCQLSTRFQSFLVRQPQGISAATIQGVSDDNAMSLWGQFTWEGMPYGRGDGTLDSSGNATVNKFYRDTGSAQDLVNTSPAMQSWNSWALIANASGGGVTTTLTLSSNTTTANVGNPIAFTISPNVSVATIATLSDSGGGGTFFPSASATISGSTPATILYVNTVAGTYSISLTDSTGIAISGSPISVTYSSFATISLTATNTSGVPNVAITGFTVTPSQAITAVVAPGDFGSGGVFSPTSLNFSSSSTPQTFTYTQSRFGTFVINISTMGVIDVISPPVYVTISPPATKLTLASTTSGATAGGTATGFTVTPGGAITGTVVPADGGFGGTFSPTSLVFSASSTPQTFTYTQALRGTYNLTVTNNLGLTPIYTYPGGSSMARFVPVTFR